jgi:valyl-tRNA synthetase
MQELVRGVRDARNRYLVDARTPLSLSVRCSASVAGDFQALAPFITLLAGIGDMTCGPDVNKPSHSAGIVTQDFEARISLHGLIDVVAERARLEKQIADKRKHLQGARAKLDNPNFAHKAPAEVVQQHRDLVAGAEKELATLEAHLRDLRET